MESAAREPSDLRAAEQLRTWIAQCEPGKMVFFGGAGVSTESGIPDFRSAGGLYGQGGPVPPEVIVSHSYFEEHPASFYQFYCNSMVYLDARPNQAHRKLAELEHAGVLGAVVTQNIDGLHQAAGSQQVWELHGSIHRNYCMACGNGYTAHDLLDRHAASPDGVPRCDCGGLLKPDVVLYEEPLDDAVVLGAIRAIAQADLLVVAGTSLAVYPAAGLLDYFTGSHLVIVNRTPTPRDQTADLCIAANVGEVFSF